MTTQITCVLSDNKSDFTTFYSPPIQLTLNKHYEAALITLDMYNSIPNVKEGVNDLFIYSSDNGNIWKTIHLGTGSYEIDSIKNEIQRQMIINGDYDVDNSSFYIDIQPNISKLTSIIFITNPTYQVDFSQSNTIGPLLGFTPKVLLSGYNESDNIVNITSVNSILVNVDFIGGSFVNKHPLPVIFSFYPNVPPGAKFIGRPNQLIFYPIIKSRLESIRVWLTDQDGNLLDFRGEKCTIRIVIREIKSNKNDIIEAIKELKNMKIL